MLERKIGEKKSKIDWSLFLAYCSVYNALFMALPVSSFVPHSCLLTAKSVDLMVAHDGFPSKRKLSVFFIVAIFIAVVLFKQFLIRNDV